MSTYPPEYYEADNIRNPHTYGSSSGGYHDSSGTYHSYGTRPATAPTRHHPAHPYRYESWNDWHALSMSAARKSYERAAFAFTSIMLLALFSMLLGSLISRVRTSVTRKTFAWFTSAIVIAIITLIFQFVDSILQLRSADVQYFYNVVSAIFNSFQYLADALLLAAVFTCIVPRSALVGQSVQHTRQNAALLLRLLLCGVLIILWFVITIMQAVSEVQMFRILQSGSEVQSFKLLNLIMHIERLRFAFDCISLLAALDIFGRAIRALKSSHQTNENISKNYQQSLLFLSLVSIPLLVRQIWLFAYDIKYEISPTMYYDNGTYLGVLLAVDIFYFLCTTTVYAGLMLLMKNLSRKRFSERTAYGNGKDGGNGLELGSFGPETPVLRVPARVEDPAVSGSHAPAEEPGRRQAAEKPSQGAAYTRSGPGLGF